MRMQSAHAYTPAAPSPAVMGDWAHMPSLVLATPETIQPDLPQSTADAMKEVSKVLLTRFIGPAFSAKSPAEFRRLAETTLEEFRVSANMLFLLVAESRSEVDAERLLSDQAERQFAELCDRMQILAGETAREEFAFVLQTYTRARNLLPLLVAAEPLTEELEKRDGELAAQFHRAAALTNFSMFTLCAFWVANERQAPWSPEVLNEAFMLARESVLTMYATAREALELRPQSPDEEFPALSDQETIVAQNLADADMVG